MHPSTIYYKDLNAYIPKYNVMGGIGCQHNLLNIHMNAYTTMVNQSYFDQYIHPSTS